MEETRKLMGAELTAAVVDVPPFAMFRRGADTDEVDGIDVLILKQMAAQLNFTVKYLPFKNWGKLMPNGSWVNGMVSVIASGEADVAMGFLEQTSFIYKHMDFGPSYSMTKKGVCNMITLCYKNCPAVISELAQHPARSAASARVALILHTCNMYSLIARIAFAVQRPKQIDVQWKTVVSIFQLFVWICTFATFMLVVVINKNILDFTNGHSKRKWQQSVMTTLGIFFASSYTSLDNTKRTRCLLTVWSVFCLLLTTSLSSGIVTKLTLPLYSDRVDTLQQLVEQRYYWTSQAFKRFNTTAARDYIFGKNNIWARRYIDEFKDMSLQDFKRHVEKDRKITFPFRIEGHDLAIFFPNEKISASILRKFRFLKEPLIQDYASFGFKKHFLFSEIFSVVILKFQEVGLIQYWRRDVLRRYPEYDTRHMFEEHDVPVFKGPQPLPLQKLRPVFYTLGAGYLAATCAFIVEYFSKKDL